eukprot:CAMPEP_0172817106 /NCGR_PEP_ID=MMETSP1075-20121228/12960_1 /TAXON_ID=2916 /ORGANISM="Ceratium fusus, Strain PA161109" /LENGTH=34 /DNA_ID= /DNA_START= /DNA_END= /DNA_ORIENTATION=
MSSSVGACDELSTESGTGGKFKLQKRAASSKTAA